MQSEATSVELRWSVMGDRVQLYGNYRLYSALVNEIPQLKSIVWQLGGFSGTAEDIFLKLHRGSELMVRCQIQDVPLFSCLEGKVISIGQSFVQLGPLVGFEVLAKEELVSDITIIKLGEETRFDVIDFAVSLGKQLQQLDIASMPKIGPKRSLPIKQQHILGFEISFSNLKPIESIILQSYGLGGKRRMGCGVFC
jgi:CRISPR-associated protein Cas6